MKDDVERSMTRFRSEHDLQFPYMLANVERNRNHSEFKFLRESLSGLSLVCGLDTPEEVQSELFKVLKNSKPYLCFNDDIKTPRPEHGVIIHAFFEALIGNNVTANTLILSSKQKCV